ncbi:MAG TPA: NAD(P)-dependent oxidoreductase [Trinickia sp.]|uniref:NAD(P)-dependent oxidoreductase n=1 Tax=Trinickia sp. TaxID=2571163 RepID=UPI002F406BA8
MDTPDRVIGMIGIGQLGLPIATNLIQAGFQVVGYRRTDREAFVACGGRALDNAADVTRQADVLLLCLPSEAALLDVLQGADGVLDAIRPGLVVVELATYRKAFKIDQAKRIQERGACVLEAEVSGSPPMVSQHRASLYLGGSAELIKQCKPVLDAITANQFHIGEYGSAVAMKLIANYLVAIHTLACAEAMNLGARLGFDPGTLAEVVKHGAGGSTMFAIRAPMMAARAFRPAPGTIGTLEKYLLMGRQLVDEAGAASPLFSTAAPYFLRAIENGMAEEDIAAVIKLLESESRPERSQAIQP